MYTRRYMDMITNPIVVIHRAGGVEDYVASNRASRVDNHSCQDDCSQSHLDITGNDRSRMDYCDYDHLVRTAQVKQALTRLIRADPHGYGISDIGSQNCRDFCNRTEDWDAKMNLPVQRRVVI
jgi:hypothetical protein